MISRIVWCSAVVVAFVVAEWRGVNLLPTTAHAVIPASVRTAPNGYRDFARGSYGFHGGK